MIKTVLRSIWLFVFLFMLPLLSHAEEKNSVLAGHRWIHGAKNCSTNKDPAIEIYKFDQDTYILRQNKCVHFEAPFIYVLFGSHTVLVQDTGASKDAKIFPLYATVRALVEKRSSNQSQPLDILVIHSHSHGDHKAADTQFKHMPHVTLVEPNKEGLNGFLASAKTQDGIVDLGERQLNIFRIPGHQAESIALYDSHTKWLLTGDSVYPGIISILDWKAYVASVKKLVQFASTHEVSAVLGSHIEMSKTPAVVYARGSTYQPEEASLFLPVEVLSNINLALAKTQGKRQEVVMDAVNIKPVSLPLRMLIWCLKILGFG